MEVGLVKFQAVKPIRERQTRGRAKSRKPGKPREPTAHTCEDAPQVRCVVLLTRAPPPLRVHSRAGHAASGFSRYCLPGLSACVVYWAGGMFSSFKSMLWGLPVGAI